jgi:serine/threonine protein kinase
MREQVTFQLPPPPVDPHAAAAGESIFADPKGREAFDVTEDTHELTQSGNGSMGSTDSHQHSYNNNSSHRSTGSHGSSSKSPSLRENLTRVHKDRDPFNVFSTVKILGKGSMGNVSLVRRRTIGGSARYNAAARAAVQEKYDNCFQMPVIGGCFQFFLQGKAQAEMEKASMQPLNGRSALIVMDKTESSSMEATSLADGTQPIYAMKSIHYNLIKDKVFVDELLNEVAVLKALDHPHIVRIQETFDYKSQLYVVMEVCSGGDLYTRDPYTEEQAARIISAVLSAVSYMHQRNVIHRDIKYENILFANDSPMASVKLIDFGLSQEMKEHEHIKDSAGTM